MNKPIVIVLILTLTIALCIIIYKSNSNIIDTCKDHRTYELQMLDGSKDTIVLDYLCYTIDIVHLKTTGYNFKYTNIDGKTIYIPNVVYYKPIFKIK